MMGEQKSEPQLFSYAVNLEKRVRSDHPLRRVAKLIDFKFVREEVPPCYGSKGNVSVINWEDRSRWFPTPTP
jgi:hypothetical protein